MVRIKEADLFWLACAGWVWGVGVGWVWGGCGVGVRGGCGGWVWGGCGVGVGGGCGVGVEKHYPPTPRPPPTLTPYITLLSSPTKRPEPGRKFKETPGLQPILDFGTGLNSYVSVWSITHN